MLPVLTHPNPLLRQVSKKINPAEINTPAMQQLIDDMIVTMYHDDGIGLAAPQIDHRIRLYVVGKDALKKFKLIEGDIPKNTDIALINPSWIRRSKKTDWDNEGCLSVPHVYGKVKRYVNITVSALDRYGKPLKFEANNYLARVVQHEGDHLDGVLFIDKAVDVQEAKNI